MATERVPFSASTAPHVIRVASEFSATPGGRNPKNGPFNGEVFRERFLVPALRDHSKVVVELDGTDTYIGSFLEEAFGGLLREPHEFNYDVIQSKLEIVGNGEFAFFRDLAIQYMKDQEKKNRRRR